MEQSFTPTTGAHLAVVNKVQDGMECLKHVQEVIERYNGEFCSEWKLNIQQYHRKKYDEDDKKEAPSSTTTLISSSSLDGYVLISGKNNSIIADKSMSIIFHDKNLFLTNIYEIIVEGKEFRINDIIIRFGVVMIKSSMKNTIVVDFEYLPSVSRSAIPILEDIRKLIYPEGLLLRNTFYNMYCSKALKVSDFDFRDLAELYSGIITEFKKL